MAWSALRSMSKDWMAWSFKKYEQRLDGLECTKKYEQRLDGLECTKKYEQRLDGLECTKKYEQRLDGLESGCGVTYLLSIVVLVAIIIGDERFPLIRKFPLFSKIF